MASDFSELQTELNIQRQEHAVLADFHGKMASSDFKPIDHPIKGFTGYETPAEIADHIQNVMPQLEADFQLLCIDNSIEQLNTAMVLIETQLAYRDKVSLPAADFSIDDDQEGFATILKKTFDLNNKHKDAHLPRSLDQNSFFKTVSEITDDYAAIVRGSITKKLAAQSSDQLLNKIYELRIYFADLVLKKTELVIENTGTNLEAVLLFKKSLDERIIEPSVYVDNAVEKSMRDTGGNLAAIALTHKAIHTFLGQTHEMDKDNDGLRDFKADSYAPATILGMAQFTP